jgi:hypothetical protein
MLRMILPPNATNESIGATAERYAGLSIKDMRKNLDRMIEEPIAPCIEKDAVTVTPRPR